MTPAFSYRRRRDQVKPTKAHVGETITLDERTEYVLSFPGSLSSPVMRQIADLGGELLATDAVVLSFGNFVGKADLSGVTIDVTSTKIGDGGVSRLLEEVSDLASGLVFGWRAPTTFAAVTGTASQAPVPYHQLQLLRHFMLKEPPGQRLQDWISAIERNPTRRFEPDRPVVSPDRVRRLDHRAVQSIFTRVERLVPAGAAVANNDLAQALSFGSPREPHFPAKVAAPRGRLSFDTPENRFVKHVLGECLSLIYRFIDHPKLHAGLRADCRTMLGVLEDAAPFLAEVGRLSGFHSPSQALAKADGYREVFGFWGNLSRHVSLPGSASETARLLEGRDMATLYEYWVFLKVLEATCMVTGTRPTCHPALRRDELGESLVVGLTSTIGENLSVRFNPTFTRSQGDAYSTPLRPDVIIEFDGTRYVFDAKYRLDRFDCNDADADDGPATYKRADLYKMHTYRDAISGIQAAFVVYPGTEFVFFERARHRLTDPSAITQCDGAGAVPLRPSDSDPACVLRALLRKVLTKE